MVYLITGATGEIGSRVVDQLLQRGERPRVFVRDAEKALHRFGDRVDIWRGDYEQPESLKKALNGVDALFVVAVGPRIPEQDSVAASCAKASGLKHIVKLSTIDLLPDLILGSWHQRGETAIAATGIPFTFIRPSGFMSNLLAWAQSVKIESIVRSSTGEGRRPFIHPDDIAAVAVEALSGQYQGARLAITGPEALTFEEITARISAAVKKPLRYQSISDEEARTRYSATGAPEVETEAHVALWRAIRENRLADVTDTVDRVLSRKPIGFDRWLQENAGAFA